MHAEVNEFLEQQMKGLTELAENLRRSRVAAARRAAAQSAARIRSLNDRVRQLARSGVRVTSVSHGAVQRLIELQSDIVTSALTDAAAQIQRMAYTESVRDLARVQAEVLQATRQRIVADITRAVTILKGAAADVGRSAAGRRPAAAAARRPAAAAAPRKRKTAARKTSVGARRKAKTRRTR